MSVLDCIFCKIVARVIQGDEVYRDEDVVAFRDVNPQAPTHILVVPTEHIASMADAPDSDPDLLAHLLCVCARVAKQHVAGNGWRVVTNVGPDGGQSVDHLHLHVLGGREMGWPPG